MKINTTAEKDGNDSIQDMIHHLASLKYPIETTAAEIKTQVQNKDGKWIDFDPAKIKFIFNR